LSADDLDLELSRLVRGRVLPDEPLSRHTSMGVGGRARALVVPHDEEDILRLLALCRERGIPCHVIGRGTNLIVSDDPFPGVILKVADTLRSTCFDNDVLRAGGGASLPGLARLTVARGLAGLEFAGGIPGTLGGGVTMNAGVGREWIGPVVREVRVVRPGGVEERLPAARIRFAYRETSLAGRPGVVLEATLVLHAGDREALREAMSRWHHHRRETQPLRLPNAGSMFRNPPEDHAGRLLEGVGAKGWREGAAEVSTLHANFIVNHGGARAEDVVRLMWREWNTVRERFGVEMVPEVHFLGFRPGADLPPGSRRVLDFGQPA
jgi:UDP-N-acetylmuramate dehydrogenase